MGDAAAVAESTAREDGAAGRRGAPAAGAAAAVECHSMPITFVLFSEDGTLLVTCSADKTAILHRVASSPEGLCTLTASKTLAGHKEAVTSAAFSPKDKHMLATSSADKTVRLWNTETGAHTHTLRGHGKSVTHVTFSADGSFIVSSSEDMNVIIWSRSSRDIVRILASHEGAVEYCDCSPPGRRLLVSASRDRTLKLWNVQTGAMLRSFVGHTDAVVFCQFSPHWPFIASASADGTSRIWHVDTGDCLAILAASDNGPLSMGIFSPDGWRLLVASQDGSLHVWSLERCAVVATHECEGVPVQACAYSPDNKHILAVAGCKVLIFGNGAQALDPSRPGPPSLEDGLPAESSPSKGPRRIDRKVSSVLFPSPSQVATPVRRTSKAPATPRSSTDRGHSATAKMPVVFTMQDEPLTPADLRKSSDVVGAAGLSMPGSVTGGSPSVPTSPRIRRALPVPPTLVSRASSSPSLSTAVHHGLGLGSGGTGSSGSKSRGGGDGQLSARGGTTSRGAGVGEAIAAAGSGSGGGGVKSTPSGSTSGGRLERSLTAHSLRVASASHHNLPASSPSPTSTASRARAHADDASVSPTREGTAPRAASSHASSLDAPTRRRSEGDEARAELEAGMSSMEVSPLGGSAGARLLLQQRETASEDESY